jgi:predicted enzyme related to lactoylglutathione lyase
MITGIHAVVFAPATEEVRTFFRDVLALTSVDAAGGWPIFSAPPAELAVHPADESGFGLYLMCDDLEATIRWLAERNVQVREPTDQSWGRVTAIVLAGGTEIGLYQPRHARPR